MKIIHNRRGSPRLLTLALALFLLGAGLGPSATVSADHTPAPGNVTIAGSLQSELGCPGDWLPDCAATHLAYDASDDV